jgi:hypothetical protein
MAKVRNYKSRTRKLCQQKSGHESQDFFSEARILYSCKVTEYGNEKLVFTVKAGFNRANYQWLIH